jgi:DNA-binding IclR family transcriptional regulator
MEHRRKDKTDYVIHSVTRALDILEAFTYQDEELGVTELSQKLSLHKNNVFRLLATLETRGYIEQDRRTGNYRLGIKTFEVASVFLEHLRLGAQAGAILESLVGKCNESAYLAVRDGAEAVYLLVEETSHTVRLAPRLGRRVPGYCTAAGKAQLAYERPERLEQLFKQQPLRRLTPHTLSDAAALLAHLREVAAQGFAVDDEEWEFGVRCVAAPVRDYSHRVVGAIGLHGPAFRFSGERIATELVPIVREAGARLSQRLGYEAAAPRP